MKMLLSMDEALSMAVQIESNATAFYRRAAALQTDGKNASFLERLAAMEDGHRKTFSSMRSNLSKSRRSTDELDQEGGLFLSAIASGFRVEGSSSAAASLTGGESLENILRTGISLEQQSVLFYTGLQDLFPSRSQRKILSNIIEEEKGHITALAGKFSELDCGGNPA